MDTVCPQCGDETFVSKTVSEVTIYCSNCGYEDKRPSLPGERPKLIDTGIVSLKRASILKQINSKAKEEPKRPKQLRDRTDYTKARRIR
jgi:uncharacterized Zn finger protein